MGLFFAAKKLKFYFSLFQVSAAPGLVVVDKIKSEVLITVIVILNSRSSALCFKLLPCFQKLWKCPFYRQHNFVVRKCQNYIYYSPGTTLAPLRRYIFYLMSHSVKNIKVPFLSMPTLECRWASIFSLGCMLCRFT